MRTRTRRFLMLLAAISVPTWPAGAGRAAPLQAMKEGSGRGDLDGDGQPDCWRLGYDGGSGYGSWNMELRPSCGKRTATIDLGSSFGDFCSIAPLPRWLGPALVDGLVDRWFGAGVRRPLADADGSLAWLIERYQQGPRGETRGRRWASPRRYTPRWQAGPPELPPEQAVILRGPEDERLTRAVGRALGDSGDPPVNAPALLWYRAANHGKLTEAARAGGLTVYLTAHGVAVRDDGRAVWSWAYIGTDQLKLRWPTTVRAVTDGKIVAVERWVQDEGNEKAGRELVVIDPRAGRYATRRLGARERWSLDPRLARQLEGAAAPEGAK